MATLNYKCPNCDGPLTFNPDKQMFSCDYCGSFFPEQQIQQLYAEREKKETFDEREVKKDEQRKAQAKAEGIEDDGYVVSYSCPACGAEVVTTENTAATTCFYCQNPVVLGGRLSEKFKPDRVIPFALSKEKAIDKFMEMCGKKKFLPKGFASKKQFEKLQGVYFPYWYVDEKKQASMVATGKKVRHWTTGDRRYTETSTFRLFRTGDITLNNVAECAINAGGNQKPGEKLSDFERALNGSDKDMLNCIHPFDLSGAKPFSMSFLSGFLAQKRNLEQNQVDAIIEQKMQEYSKQLLKGTMSGYEGISEEQYNDQIFDKKWNYTLLPLWIVTYKFKDEILLYAINGQTGKTYGKLPISIGKAIAIGAIIAVIIFIIVTLGGMFFV